MAMSSIWYRNMALGGVRASISSISLLLSVRNTQVWTAFVDELRSVLDDVHRWGLLFDPDRVYITGLSLGGFGTWAMVLKFPEIFVAAAPICGGVALGGMPKSTTLRELLSSSKYLYKDTERMQALECCSGLPIWLFHGKKINVLIIVVRKKLIFN